MGIFYIHILEFGPLLINLSLDLNYNVSKTAIYDI